MAIFYMRATNVCRTSRSSVATIAYQTGEKLTDERTGLSYNYECKKGVAYSEIVLCDNAPERLKDRSELWNEVERLDKNANARTAKSFVLALPKELTLEQNIELCRGYFKDNFSSNGLLVDYAIHEPDKGNDNWHVHATVPNRSINDKGEWNVKERKDYCVERTLANGEVEKATMTAKEIKERASEGWKKIPLLDENGQQKVRVRKGKGEEKLWQKESVQANVLSDRTFYLGLRTNWANTVNRNLEQCGHEARISEKSLEEQGIDREAQIHVGQASWHMAKKGIITERYAENEIIKARNEIKIIDQQINNIEYEKWNNSLEIKSLQMNIHIAKEQEPAPAEQKQGYEEMAAIYEKSKNAHVLEPANTHKTEVFEKTAERQAEAKAKIEMPEKPAVEPVKEKLADLNQGKNHAEVKKPAIEPEQELAKVQQKINHVRNEEMNASIWVKSSEKVYDHAKTELRKAEKALEHRKEELQNTTGLFKGGKRKELQEKIKRLEEKVIPEKKERLAEAKEEYKNKEWQVEEYRKELADLERTKKYLENAIEFREPKQYRNLEQAYEAKRDTKEMLNLISDYEEYKPIKEKYESLAGEEKQAYYEGHRIYINIADSVEKQLNNNGISPSDKEHLGKRLESINEQISVLQEKATQAGATQDGTIMKGREEATKKKEQVIVYKKEYFEEPEKQKSKTQSWSHDR